MFRLFLIFLSSVQFTGINSDLISPNLDLNYLQILNQLIKVLDKLPKGDCVDQFLVLFDSLSNNEEWAIRMIDASAKPQSGILMGNIFHVGNYDECLEIDATVKNDRIQGKYCTAFLNTHPQFGKDLAKWLSDFMEVFNKGERNLADDARLSYGLCVPKMCPVEILQNISNALGDSAESPLRFNFLDEFCDGGDSRPYTTAAIVTILIFSIFALILVLSTLYDIFVYSKLIDSEKTTNLLVSFSVLTNGKKLLATNVSKDDLSCLNGMRVISMMWIVLGHIYELEFFFPHINSKDIVMKWKNSKENMFIMAGPMSVDTFFAIGGLLVVYLFMKSQSRGIKFSLPMFYLHRILRLTPALAMVVLMTTTIVVYMGSGPFWPVIYPMYQKNCEDTWWATLIYLQNILISRDEQCLGQSWYLAVDTQMYFLSPLVLFPLLKWPKLTLSAIIVVVLSVSSYVFAISWIKHLGATFFDQDPDMPNLLYFTTHVRGIVYLIGMICGYFVYTTKFTRPLKLTKFQTTVLWVSSLAVMLGICFAYSAMASATEYNVLSAAFFNTFTRVGWAVALSVIIVLCVNDYGGPINAFLSNKFFTVLIRLNYSIFLLHAHVIILLAAQEKTSTYFRNLFCFRQFWGYYMFSVGWAIIWTLAFESPVIAIEKIVFGRTKESHLNTSENGLTKSKIDEDSVLVRVGNK